jgi:hypothetical protein
MIEIAIRSGYLNSIDQWGRDTKLCTHTQKRKQISLHIETVCTNIQKKTYAIEKLI